MLYIVATPIGNLKDISLRALEVLKEADEIACEDTRHTLKLLNFYEIKKPLFSYHKFNENSACEKLLTKLSEGKNIALVSDAGTPVISDPGNILIKKLVENNIKYTVIPGACALVNGLVLSGFNSARFIFLGFLPKDNKKRSEILNNYSKAADTLIFYVSPHSYKKDISDIYKIFGERRAAIVREISKIHEEAVFLNLSDDIKELLGEMVLIVEGAEQTENPLNGLSVEEHFDYYINSGFSKMQAVKAVAKDRNVNKNEIYMKVVGKR